MMILTGVCAEEISVEKALELNSHGYAVTVADGRLIVQKEKATGEGD